MEERGLHRIGTSVGMCVLSALLIGASVRPVFAKSTAHEGIALSDSYAGNSWRQEMTKIWNITSHHAIANGIISKTTVVDADKSVSQQESQIDNLILSGWNAIAVVAGSTTALDGVIEKACHAGIVVVAFNSLAKAPCAYKVAVNVTKLGEDEARFVARALHGRGNVLAVRGIAGSSWDADDYRGITEVFKKYPKIKIVGVVRGDWTQSIAQKAVAGILPSLPTIQAVVTQGGDGYGTYEAFRDAGRKLPLIVFGNRQEELALWAQLENRPGGYHTLSLASPSGVSSIAFWVAQRVLAGAKVPKVINVPPLIIHANKLHSWLKVLPKGTVATPLYSKAWTEKLIKANLDHTPLPPPPAPQKIP